MQARNWFQEALTTATEEAKAEDAAFEGPQPAELAKAIEAALFKHFGKAFHALCSIRFWLKLMYTWLHLLLLALLQRHMHLFLSYSQNSLCTS